MKKKIKVVLGVSPVLGTRNFLGSIMWRMKFRDEVLSWGKKRFPKLCLSPTIEELKKLSVYRILYLESRNEFSDNKIGRAFIITQKYIHEEKG